MRTLAKKQYRLCWIMTLLVVLATGGLAQGRERFPLYPDIKPNVRFWEKIYSRYTTRQGVLHDKHRLNIIYTVIDLADWSTPGSARVNRELIKLARRHYKKILAQLGAGRKPVTRDEKRVAAMFPTRSRLAFRRARDDIRLQIGQKDRFLQGVIRSGAYMHAIKKIFISYGLPAELAYLPHVESSYNPKAYSKAGASGIWQFTRATGRQYMTINRIIDERNDPLLSTRAAARFLKSSYEQLGSWPLALTAYNYGQAGMERALRERKSYENIFNNHRTRLFRFASRNFYSEFLAAVHTARKLEKNPAIILDRPQATLTIRLRGYVSVSDIRGHFKVSAIDFSRLNPALREPALAGEKYIPKGFPVRLPANRRTRRLVANIPSRFYHARQIRDHEYIVRRGDTANAIARRYRITVAKLVRVNNLSRKATIRIDQKLKIPGRIPAKKREHITLLRTRSKFQPD
ncbi:MAG: transglycosylase SLT domain-containing protein [Proteobacteria bacterium]|nr:transglycosylase SLT domain-containing protein [Pseudomonadota bacterium]